MTLKRTRDLDNGEGLRYLRVEVLRGSPSAGDALAALGINPATPSRIGDLRKVPQKKISTIIIVFQSVDVRALHSII